MKVTSSLKVSSMTLTNGTPPPQSPSLLPTTLPLEHDRVPRGWQIWVRCIKNSVASEQRGGNVRHRREREGSMEVKYSSLSGCGSSPASTVRRCRMLLAILMASGTGYWWITWAASCTPNTYINRSISWTGTFVKWEVIVTRNTSESSAYFFHDNKHWSIADYHRQFHEIVSVHTLYRPSYN